MTRNPISFPLPAALLIAVTLAGCGSTTTPTQGPAGSAGPAGTPAPTGSPGIDGIQHATGAHDVVLRMETSGGFAPIEFIATSAPSFTLYGDGTVVFRDPSVTPPNLNDNVNRSVPFQTLRLGEDAFQSLLRQAIGPGGLGIAVGPYIGLGADIPSTTFTLVVDGSTKSVSVTGLSPDMHPGDAQIVSALSHLADVLDGFGRAVGGGEAYEPSASRGVLTPMDQAVGPALAWPWTTINPTDFVKSANNEFLLTHTLSAADVATLGIKDAEGGLQGLTLKSGARLYSFSLRPLLPDEAS